jgi:hypothetical protein
MRVVLWDTNHISLIENGEIKSDDVVEIKNCTMRENEIHLTSFSELKKSKEKIENVQTARVIAEKTIAEIQENQPVRFRAVIVQIFPPRFFTVCNECGKKVVQEADGFSCQTHGRVMGRERALLNLVLDDGTETMRSVLFSDQISKLMSEEDLKTKFEQIKRDLLGTEVHVQGTARRNQMFNNIELTIQDISRVDVDKLIEELEKS